MLARRGAAGTVAAVQKQAVLRPNHVPVRAAAVPDGTTVLCAGMFRSGSTWAYNVVREVLRRGHPDATIEAGYHEGDELSVFVDRRLAGYRVAKFHLVTPAIVERIRVGAVGAVVHSRRDPMTALASCVEQFCANPRFSSYWTHEQAVEHVVDGLRLGRALAELPQVVTIDLHAEGEPVALERIVAHLRERVGVELRAADVDAVRAEFTFERMRERSLEIAGRPEGELLRGINDPETLMHGGHVDKGTGRDWAGELSPELVADARSASPPCDRGRRQASASAPVSASASISVFQASVAHLIRTGNLTTPCSASRSPSFTSATELVRRRPRRRPRSTSSP